MIKIVKKIVFCIIGILPYLLYGQSPNFWGEYRNVDTLYYGGQPYIIHSKLILNEQDSSYHYFITADSSTFFSLKQVESIGKIEIKEGAIYLKDRLHSTTTIGIKDIYSQPGYLCGNSTDYYNFALSVTLFVPFEPNQAYNQGFGNNVEWGLIFNGDTTKKYEAYNSRYNQFINLCYVLKLDSIEVDYFQIYRTQIIEYFNFVNGIPGDKIPSKITSYSKCYYPRSQKSLFIQIDCPLFIPYIDSGWLFQDKEGKVFLERLSYNTDDSFIYLEKVTH